jgi:hypothetical protein
MTPPVPPHSRLGWTILVTLSALALPHTAHAAWPHSPGINVPICTATGDQQGPAIAPDGAGGAIIAWRDGRTDLGDIYVQRVRASGGVDPAWPANGRALCTAGNTQQDPQIVSDGAGGAIVVWEDFRNASDYDTYAQHVLASGAVDPAWPANGRSICGAALNQQWATVISDGAGGAIITWQDFRNSNTDVFAQHVLSTGVVDGAWPVNGRAVCLAGNGQDVPSLVSDGSGGAIITWMDLRSESTWDIYAQHVLSSGVVDGAWPADGRALCVASDNQLYPVIASDGGGGAIVTWHDLRGGSTYDIYAQRVLSTGFVDPAWPSNGRAICALGGDQGYPSIISDGAGGAIIAWQDTRSSPTADIYAHHVLGSGAVDGAWPTDGRALCTASSDQFNAKIVSDGAGGAIITWYDFRGPANWDIYAHHVFASGVADGAWPVNGRGLSIAPDIQSNPAIAADGAGGAIVVWQDYRTGTNLDIYAQRVAPSGYLGNPEPGIVSVRDVPNDNGGNVKLSWAGSYLDTEQPYFVDHYWIFRNAPPDFAELALTGGARLLAPGDPEPLPGEQAFFAAPPSVSTTYYWEYVASSPAAHFTSNYSYVASTTSDSMGAGNPKTAFLVVAYNAASTVFFTSNADSGYSVDNVPPVAPGPLAATYEGGATVLHWNANPEADVEGYRIYRGGSAGFVPGAGNLIASPSGTDYADAGPAGSYYKLSAVDRHGNESDYTLLAPSGTVGVSGSDLPVELALGRPAPNPAIALATVRLALPRASSVKLSVHDMAGRQVRDLYSGAMAAGERDMAWDLRDASGARVADGLYFMRLTVEGRTIARRVAVVH